MPLFVWVGMIIWVGINFFPILSASVLYTMTSSCVLEVIVYMEIHVYSTLAEKKLIIPNKGIHIHVHVQIRHKICTTYCVAL